MYRAWNALKQLWTETLGKISLSPPSWCFFFCTELLYLKFFKQTEHPDCITCLATKGEVITAVEQISFDIPTFHSSLELLHSRRNPPLPCSSLFFLASYVTSLYPDLCLGIWVFVANSSNKIPRKSEEVWVESLFPTPIPQRDLYSDFCFHLFEAFSLRFLHPY